MNVSLYSNRTITLKDLLKLATNKDKQDPNLNDWEGVKPEYAEAAKLIIAEFYFSGDTVAAERTIDFYEYLQTEAGESVPVQF